MGFMGKKFDKDIKFASIMGGVCSLAYLVVYIARNILSVATPEMLNSGYTTEYIGIISTVFMLTYAVGQLVNGIIGDFIKSKYMICLGLAVAAVGNFLFLFCESLAAKAVFYGIFGFAMSMVYAPMTKLISENLKSKYVTTALLGLGIAALIASPLAGIVAMLMNWKAFFAFGQILLLLAAAICFVIFTYFEKTGRIEYGKFNAGGENSEKSGMIAMLKALLDRDIIRYTFISVFTGIIRTSVVFWIPTMLVQYMSFPQKSATGVYSVVTAAISVSPYFGVWCYHFFFKKNIEKTNLVSFMVGAICFFLMCFAKNAWVNVVLLIFALLGGNIASSMLWNVYCPSLRDTGMVSTATGYLDFISYIGGAIANIAFSNAVTYIGWRPLLAIWGAMMLAGAAVGVPWRKTLNKNGDACKVCPEKTETKK